MALIDILRTFALGNSFISFDPEALYSQYLHHEAGHILLAHYYGFRFGNFRFFLVDGFQCASIQTGVNNVEYSTDRTQALTKKARQLLAGELAARIAAGISLNQIVFGSKFAATMSRRTSLHSVMIAIHECDPDFRHDISKIFEIAFILEASRWWTWIWSLHKETFEILQSNWTQVTKLAASLRHLAPVPPAQQLQISGEEILQLCRQLHFPIENSERPPSLER